MLNDLLSVDDNYLKDGEPCPHIGCLHHVTHPCEGCGRIAGRSSGICKHTSTQGLDGESGGWCVDCGKKIYEVETRGCGDCKHCKDCGGNYHSCKPHLMRVTPDMRVTYKVEDGTCWEGR